MRNNIIYMKKCVLLIAIVLLQSFRVNAPIKMIFDLNVGINKSIATNLLKTEIISGNHIQYYSRQRYKYTIS